MYLTTKDELELKTLSAALLTEPTIVRLLTDFTVDDFDFPLAKDSFLAIIAIQKSGSVATMSLTREYMLQAAHDENMLQRINEWWNLASGMSVLSWEYGAFALMLQKENERKRLLSVLEKTEANVRAGQSAEDGWAEIMDAYKLTLQSKQGLCQPEFETINDTPLELFSTGIDELDNEISGFARRELIVVGARPGIGKTAFGLQILRRNVEAGKHVLFFSLEMGAPELVNRIWSSVTGIEHWRIRQRRLNTSEIVRLNTECRDWAEKHYPFMRIGHSSKLQVITQQIAQSVAQENVDVVIIDYLGLMRASGGSEYENLCEISASLKNIAVNYNVAVIALHQLNREVKNRVVPCLTDLRGSGSIEQDADKVLFLYEEQGETKLAVEKNRAGRITRMDIHFDKDRQSFSSGLKINKPYVQHDKAEAWWQL